MVTARVQSSLLRRAMASSDQTAPSPAVSSQPTKSPPSSNSSQPPPPSPTTAPPPLPSQPPSPPSNTPSPTPPSPPSNDPSPTPPSNDPSPTPPSPRSALPTPPSSKAPSPPVPSSGTPGEGTPPSHKSSPVEDDPNAPLRDHRSNVNVPLIVGICSGLGLFLVLMMISALICCIRNKRKKPGGGSMHYYTDSGGAYYGNGQVPKWNNGHQGIQPPPAAVGQHQHGAGWRQQSPPALMGNSADMSSFSGPNGSVLPPPSPNIALGFNKSTFTYEELAAATNGFSQANLLGQGGFGYVHKGVLPNGKEVAVKQLKAGSGQGEREFQAEVDIISRVHHRHLVSLVGYCIAGSKRVLVYDFVSNGTLEYHLHGRGLPVMEWPTRLKIAIGSAKGLAYLHEDCHPRIIHRDIKAANILLDNKFEAMVADFGLAKLSADNNTHVSTRVMGTFGYLAPEYASSGKLTEKSDVFSYGVMLLELLTGRRPVDSTHSFMEDSLVDWARPLLSRALDDDNFEELVDPRLGHHYNANEMAHMASCAAACVRHSARRRPKMSQIVRALEGDVSLDDLNEGMRPGQSSIFSSGSDYDSGSYATNMRRLRQVALGSTEFSNEYSGPSGDHGFDPAELSSSGEMDPFGDPRHKAHPSVYNDS